MKHFAKIFAVTGLALSVAAFTAPKAQAFGGWAVAGAAIGGLAVGTAVGATVAANSAPPAYYVYPAQTCVTPVVAPAPVVVAPPVVAPVRYCAAPVVVAPHPYFCGPVVRVGWGCGYGHGYGWGRSYSHWRR